MTVKRYSEKVTEDESAEHWEAALVKANLGMNRGIARQVSYVGSTQNLVGIEEEELSMYDGQPIRNLQGFRIRPGGRRIVPK